MLPNVRKTDSGFLACDSKKSMDVKLPKSIKENDMRR
jgi:hypothetical protein